MHIDLHLTQRGEHTIAIDGTDVTREVLKAGFRVDLDDAGRPIIHLSIRPGSASITGDVFAVEAPPVPTCPNCGGAGHEHCAGWVPGAAEADE